MSYKSVPGDIWLRSFESLDLKDVYNCIFVCKDWVKTAAQEYYEELTLTTKLVKSLKVCVALENGNKELDNLQYVNKLQLKNEEGEFDMIEFTSLLFSLQDLRMLDIGSSNNRDQYLKLLLNLDDAQNYLDRLEEITKRSNYRRDDLSFLVCCKFLCNMTHLSLSSLATTYTINRKIGNCLHFLPSFTHLTHLRLYKNEGNSMLYEFIEACPNLVNISFVNNIATSTAVVPERSVAPPSTYNRNLKLIKVWLNKLQDPYISLYNILLIIWSHSTLT